MSFLVLAYPELSEKDFQPIQEFRKNYDPLYSVVDPHFTLVFPIADLKKEDFVSEITDKSQGFEQFEFTICQATIHKDSFSNSFFVFLVPDKKHNDFIKLHDQLYSDRLSKHLRRDID